MTLDSSLAYWPLQTCLYCTLHGIYLTYTVPCIVHLHFCINLLLVCLFTGLRIITGSKRAVRVYENVRSFRGYSSSARIVQLSRKARRAHMRLPAKLESKFRLCIRAILESACVCVLECPPQIRIILPTCGALALHFSSLRPHTLERSLGS